MPSLFEPQTANETLQRINKLTPDTKGLWGKMSVSQMMAHVQAVLALGTGERTEKPTLIGRLMGPWIKKNILSDKPFKHSLPTGPSFIMKEEKQFEAEQQKLLASYHLFINNGTAAAEGRRHPLFGVMTADEWGFSQWKHFDHHLKQFGV